MNEIMNRALANAMRPLVELVYKLEAKLVGKPHFEWGTVVSADPLRVKLDSHTTPLPDRPDTLVSRLSTGERVRVERQGTRVTVHGAGGGVTGQPYAMAAGRVSITPVANSATAATVTLPIGRFTQAPVPSAVPQSGAAAVLASGGVGVTGATTTSLTINLYRSTATATTVEWIAVQMNATDAEG